MASRIDNHLLHLNLNELSAEQADRARKILGEAREEIDAAIAACSRSMRPTRRYLLSDVRADIYAKVRAVVAPYALYPQELFADFPTGYELAKRVGAADLMGVRVNYLAPRL